MNVKDDKRAAEVLASIDKMMQGGSLTKKQKETIKGWCSEYGVRRSFSGDRCYWEAAEEIADKIIRGGGGAEGTNITDDGYVLVEQFRDFAGRAWLFGKMKGRVAGALPESVVARYFKRDAE